MYYFETHLMHLQEMHFASVPTTVFVVDFVAVVVAAAVLVEILIAVAPASSFS